MFWVIIFLQRVTGWILLFLLLLQLITGWIIVGSLPEIIDVKIAGKIHSILGIPILILLFFHCFLPFVLKWLRKKSR